jgi:gliding motility-associated-like protein
MVTDAAGCTNSFSDAVGNTGAPTISTNWQTNPMCNGSCDGSISVTASGVNAPFTYSWNTSPVQTTSSVSNLCPGTYIVQAINSVNCSSFSSFTLPNPAQMSLNPTITNVSCNGGSNGNICLSPSGGTSPYTYQWLPGGQTTSCRNSLSAGTYSVVVTDAGGCDDTIAIPVAQPALLNVAITYTNVTCNGNCNGVALANVTGGTTLYTYAWSNGAPLSQIVGLCPNTYSINVTDANGCTASGSVTITQPAVLTSSITSTNITCNLLCDGTATMNPAGGTTPYSYLWNTTPNQTTGMISGLCVGNYQSTVTDANGCTSSNTVSITQPSAISVSVSTTNATCSGGCNGSATATVSGGTGAYTYLWNPSSQTTSAATGLCTGTYTLSVTDANGCPDPVTFSISAPPILQANITNVSPTCFGGCNGTATSAPIGGTGNYTYSWNTSPVQTTATATGLCSGSYTLTLSDGSGCSINQPVTIAAPPALTQASGVAGATCLVCNGSISVIASGGTSPYTFFWNTGATTANLTGLCAGVYVDSVLDANGCLNMDTIGVSNLGGPTVTVSTTSVTCNGMCDGTATVSSAVGNGPPWIYSWFPVIQTTQAITGLCATGSNPLFVTVTDTNGCKTVNGPNDILQPAALSANASVTNATCSGICNGSVTLTTSGGTGAYTFAWSPGGMTTQNISSQCAGTYTVVIKDANNCSFTAAVTIGQNTILTSSVTSTNVPCNASCVGTASVIISGGTLPYTYSWCNAQTSSAATGLCAGTCTITTTDAIGCVKIDSAVITQPNPLLANITITNPLCNNSCDGSLSASPTGGTPPYTYVWMPGNATTNSISGLCAGNDTLIITDANNCTSTTTVTLVNPLPIASTHTVTNASCANVCDGAIDITSSGGTGAYTFLWFPSGQNTQNVTGVCFGKDSVFITDGNGCSFTDTMNVNATTLVIAMAGNDTSFCLGGTATLCSNSINATSITWYNISAGWTSVGTTNCVNVSPSVGTTDFALVAVNGGCTDTDTVSVIVNNYPMLVLSGKDTICAGDSTTLCAAGAIAFTWYSLPAWTPIATGSCITVAPTSATCYGVIGLNGVCSDSDTVCVTVLAMPIAMAGNDTAFCSGGIVSLCSSSLNAVSQTWYNANSSPWTLIDTTKCISVTPPAGINNFALIASNGICSDTDTVAVTIYVAPPVNAGPDVTIITGGSSVMSATGNGTYSWSPATGLSCVTCLNPTATPSATTSYVLTVTDVNGCTASDSITVTVVNNVVPNDGLSPNGDGINDYWIIPGIASFPEATVQVFNRWGELLYSSVGYTTPWDAKYKGKDLPVGTYYYIIDLHSDLVKEPITGPITIMR